MNANLSRRLSLAATLAAFGVSMSMPALPKYVKPVYGRMVHSGGTFSAGRNAEKRAASGNPEKRMHMLADRRLRQRGVAA